MVYIVQAYSCICMAQVIAQYYQFVRLGFEGYKKIMASLLNVAARLEEGIRKLGRSLFSLLLSIKPYPSLLDFTLLRNICACLQ